MAKCKFDLSTIYRDEMGRFRSAAGIAKRRSISAYPHPDLYAIVEQHAHRLKCSMGNALLDLAFEGVKSVAQQERNEFLAEVLAKTEAIREKAAQKAARNKVPA